MTILFTAATYTKTFFFFLAKSTPRTKKSRETIGNNKENNYLFKALFAIKEKIVRSVGPA
ncbi:MAG: hypothetical protein CSA34_06470 [Desulfobulbus propionicus]|nr:MAG: hypothetical protein CSA34_06470 [Desulfobulbus propionicus]